MIGITNSDGDGIEGLELAYNKELRGKPGRVHIKQDRYGRIVSRSKEVLPVDGQTLITTIDIRLQYLVSLRLKKAVEESKSKSGSAVVLDVATGEVIALANYPSFDPANRVNLDYDSIKNRAVLDVFEPGSTIKPFSIAYAVGSGHWKLNDLVDVSEGKMKIDGSWIKDVHRGEKLLTMTDVLQKSSNVGIAKIMLHPPAFGFYNELRNLGFCEKSALDLPGESNGICNEKSRGLFELATLSFGYGISTTNLQLAQAYLVLANGGYRQDVRIVNGARSPKLRRIMSDQTAKQIRDMLKTVVKKGGTGRRGAIKGLDVAGKTGTVHVVGMKGYEKSRYVASFAGIAPVDKPKKVIVVVINEPEWKSRFGGIIAAPAFADMMSAALGYN